MRENEGGDRLRDSHSSFPEVTLSYIFYLKIKLKIEKRKERLMNKGILLDSSASRLFLLR